MDFPSVLPVHGSSAQSRWRGAELDHCDLPIASYSTVATAPRGLVPASVHLPHMNTALAEDQSRPISKLTGAADAQHLAIGFCGAQRSRPGLNLPIVALRPFSIT